MANKNVVSKILQSLCDKLCARKTRHRNVLLGVFRYRPCKSSFFARSKDEESATVEEIAIAKARFFH